MKTKLQLDLAAILRRKYPRGFHAPADIDTEMLLEFGDDDWGHELDVDVGDLLAERHAIALIWEADMLVSTYPHLTRPQAWEVLRACERDYSAEDGLTWDDVAAAVNDRFPDAMEAKQRLLDRLRTLQRQVEALVADERADPAAYGEIAAQLDSVEATVLRTGAAR